MAGQWQGFNSMPSSLPIFLQCEIKKRGKDAAWLSRKSGVDKATLSNMMNEPDVVPKIATLKKLADALGVRLGVLIRQVGFDLGTDERHEQADRLAELLEAEPRLAALYDELRQLPPGDLADIEAYVASRVDLRRQRQPDPK